MKKRILIVTLICFCYSIVLSQGKKFEKGYFIDNNNKKVECLIKNEEWDYNPTRFEYKLNENDATKSMEFSEFSEINVGGEYKYIKANVKIDKSSDFDHISGEKTMNFEQTTLLLRIRVEGKATLYAYNAPSYSRFFYSKDSGEILPLSYKIYFYKEEGEPSKNETYKQELLNALKCETIKQSDIDNLEYINSSLSELFVKYNTCSGSKAEIFTEKKNHSSFEMYLEAGVGISSFSYDNQGFSGDYSKKAAFRIGLETEINFSNKVKRWSLLIEALFRHYSNTYKYNTVTPLTSEFDYKVIDVSVGARKYFPLTEKSFLFANAYLTYGYSLDSAVRYSNGAYNIDVGGSFNPALGVGGLIDKKYSLEFRYEFNRNLFETGESKFNTIGFIAGYKFL